MKTTTIRSLAALTSVLTACAGVGSIAIGCGSNSTAVGAEDASLDQTAEGSTEDGGAGDAAADNFAAPDQGADTTLGTANEAGPVDGQSDVGDGATTIDADAGSAPDADASSTQNADASTDASADAASVQDSAPDAPSAADFVDTVSSSLCGRIRDCCLDTQSDFRMQNCLNDFGGSPLGLAVFQPYVSTGSITYDSVQATNCLNEVAAFPCGTVNAALSISLQQDCFAAFHGAVADAGACQGNVECAAGSYCTSSDGGFGTCAPLQPDGGACSRFDNTECAYLGIGVPAEYCKPRQPHVRAAAAGRCRLHVLPAMRDANLHLVAVRRPVRIH